MRWNTREKKKKAEIGDKRTRVVFAWRPKKCTAGITVWLARVHAYEEYRRREMPRTRRTGTFRNMKTGWQHVAYSVIEWVDGDDWKI